MVPGAVVFLGTLVLAAVVGAALPDERARMVAALVLFAAVLLEHLALGQSAASGGVYVTGWYVFIAVMALAIGLAFGIVVRLVAQAIKTREFSRVALATLVTLILDLALAVLVLP